MNKKTINIILALLLLSCIFFVNIAPSFAAYMDEDNTITRKERQVLEKIDIIAETFPNQIDRSALYATLVHRGNYMDYVNDSYDPDWDDDAYKEQLGNLNKDIDTVTTTPWNSIINIEELATLISAAVDCLIVDEDENAEEERFDPECIFNKAVEQKIDKPYEQAEQRVTSHSFGMQSIDLLTAATIVMLDSSGWTGNYDDEKYQKALAGTGLVGNLAESNIEKFTATVFNGLFCTVGALADIGSNGWAVDMVTTGFDPTASFSQYAEFGSSALFSNAEQRFGRYYTMTSICTNGFIGGTYQSVKNMSDEDYYQKRKNKIAKEIIGLAQTFRSMEESSGSAAWCLTGNTQAGDLSDMTPELCSEKFGPLAQADYSRTGVLASITLAQAWQESNCGKYTPPDSNNLFGIKCSDNWDGECSFAGTSEYGSGGYYNITDAFRVYPSVEESINDHSNFLIVNDIYAQAGFFNTTSYVEQAQALQSAGYATDPTYASTLISHIENYGFDKWDVKTNTTSSIDVCAPVGLGGWNIRTVAPTASDPAFNYVSDNRGQCVWYAQGRAIEIVEELGSTGKLSEEEVNHIRELLLVPPGNGGEIYDNAVARGNFNTSNNIREPKAGSYIVWKESGNYGHVAVVEEVNTTDNTITITEGWSSAGNSCPNDWSCVTFNSVTMDLDEFYNSYGPNYNGGYQFSGYVYFLEPLS